MNEDDTDFDREAPDANDRDDGPATIICPHCRREAFEDVDQCPHCGYFIHADELNTSRQWMWILFVVVAVLLILRFAIR